MIAAKQVIKQQVLLHSPEDDPLPTPLAVSVRCGVLERLDSYDTVMLI